ncbi:DinB family protein [Propioniciclava sp.]|uniref:DinB family protein n=1 Tax=Propioniciclava sp. TaxID=2038686 RepID=UPI00262C0BD3|nr:DinB family protein [Propioniciclava sp.]
MSDVSAEHPTTPPEPATPDTKDWTWVLERPCPECGFEAGSLQPEQIPRSIAEAAAAFTSAVERPDAGHRPEPHTWSVIEYGQHVADVMEVMSDRLKLILESGGRGAQFPDWDQDAAATEKEYWQANSHVTAILVKERAAAAQEMWASPTPEQWDWRGVRSNGSEFTARTLGQYFIHDLVHHVHDIGGTA